MPHMLSSALRWKPWAGLCLPEDHKQKPSQEILPPAQAVITKNLFVTDVSIVATKLPAEIRPAESFATTTASGAIATVDFRRKSGKYVTKPHAEEEGPTQIVTELPGHRAPARQFRDKTAGGRMAIPGLLTEIRSAVAPAAGFVTRPAGKVTSCAGKVTLPAGLVTSLTDLGLAIAGRQAASSTRRTAILFPSAASAA
jgi:hypothetical protein